MTGQRKDPNLDPAVAAILSDQERKRKIRQTPKDDQALMRQKMKQQEAEQERQAARYRVTLELDRVVVAALRAVADAEEVSPAAACNWLLGNALSQYAGGDLDFSGCKRGTESPRWAFTVELGQVAGELEKLLKSPPPWAVW